jgi:hypothetical protein
MTRAIRALIIDVARDSNMSDRPENVRRREHGLCPPEGHQFCE